jgi:autotransporter-associated beta strand protein
MVAPLAAAAQTSSGTLILGAGSTFAGKRHVG